MTPLGARLRQLREARGITLKDMAEAIGVSAAYLSALEHGHRTRPTWIMLQRMIGYLNVIWDEAEELQRLAELSQPKVTIDTGGLTPGATELANRLSQRIDELDEQTIAQMLTILKKS